MTQPLAKLDPGDRVRILKGPLMGPWMVVRDVKETRGLRHDAYLLTDSVGRRIATPLNTAREGTFWERIR